MELVCLKILVLLHWSVLSRAVPVAMLQHATSSQSIVFHQPPVSPAPATSATSTLVDQYSSHQPKYEYKYEVSDHRTGDRKSHWESREGDRVRGVYTLYEPDGALRTVEYTADALHGFNAVVRRDEPNKHQHSRPETSIDHGAFDSSNQSSYLGERNNFSNSRNELRYSGGYETGGYSINHGTKKADELIKPY